MMPPSETGRNISVRDRIIDAIIWHLLQIKQEDGYYNTVRNVFDPPVSLDEMQGDFPAINLDEGDESCANVNDGSHLQYGGNDAILSNSFEVSFDCVVPHMEDPRRARNQMLADIQKRLGYGGRWNIPDRDGNALVYASFYAGCTPWGIDDNKPVTGITVRYRVWYRQRLTDVTISC